MNRPKIDMNPEWEHLVEVDIDFDDIDILGNYVGHGIESYEFVRELGNGWHLLRIESKHRDTVNGILEGIDQVRHFA